MKVRLISANYRFWAEEKKATIRAEPSWKSFSSSSGLSQLGSDSSLLWVTKINKVIDYLLSWIWNRKRSFWQFFFHDLKYDSKNRKRLFFLILFYFFRFLTEILINPIVVGEQYKLVGSWRHPPCGHQILVSICELYWWIETSEGARHCWKPLDRHSETKGPISLEKYWHYFHCPKLVLSSILSFLFWIFVWLNAAAVVISSKSLSQNWTIDWYT